QGEAEAGLQGPVTPAASRRRGEGRMKVVTWNVNGIRARHEQVRDLIDRERPDVLCLQELKATREQVPDTICDHPRYWCYWHGARAYSGVGLHVSKERAGEAPRITHPAFDHETRIAEVELGDVVLASVYVPNGGKDFAAKMAFLESLSDYVTGVNERGRRLVLCGDINIALEERHVPPKERKPNAIGQRPDERTAFTRLLGRGLVDVGRALDPDNDALFT